MKMIAQLCVEKPTVQRSPFCTSVLELTLAAMSSPNAFAGWGGTAPKHKAADGRTTASK